MDRTRYYIQQIERLTRERSELEQVLLQNNRLIKGSVIQRFKTCGHPRCRCVTENKPHGPYLYLSRSIQGKTRLKRIGQEEEPWVTRAASHYREFRKARERVVKINTTIMELLNALEDLRSENYLEED